MFLFRVFSRGVGFYLGKFLIRHHCTKAPIIFVYHLVLFVCCPLVLVCCDFDVCLHVKMLYVYDYGLDELKHANEGFIRHPGWLVAREGMT